MCGGSPAVRGEQVHVSFTAKANLLASEEELKRFGVTLERVKLFIKPVAAPPQPPGLVLTVSHDPFHSHELRELVDHLRYIGISEEELLRLRLGEPEDITAHYRTDETV
jgi:hypothetical protein